MRKFFNPLGLAVGIMVILLVFIMDVPGALRSPVPYKPISGVIFSNTTTVPEETKMVPKVSTLGVSGTMPGKESDPLPRIHVALNGSDVVPVGTKLFIAEVDPQASVLLSSRGKLEGIKDPRVTTKKIVGTPKNTNAESGTPPPSMETTTPAQVTPLVFNSISKSELLRRIRGDPARLYLEASSKIDDLSFGVRNVSPEFGIEIWVQNDAHSRKNFYMPKARVGDQQGQFEEGMLSPGQKTFGFILVGNLRAQHSVDIFFSAAGMPEKKVTVKLEW